MNRLEIIKSIFDIKANDNDFSIAWLLCSDINTGSSRIHGINIHKEMIRRNIKSYIIRTKKEFNEILDYNFLDKFLIEKSKFKYVIFQRVFGEKAVKLCKELQNNGTICGFIMADIFDNDMLEIVDFIIVPSEYLKEYLINNGIDADKIFYLPDAIETAPNLKKKHISKDNIKIVWVGNEGHWETLNFIRKILRENPQLKNYELTTISSHKEATKKWNLNTVWDEILEKDIGIIPMDVSDENHLAKSNNRATMFMALGIPVVCSPLPAYLNIIENGVNGYIAQNEKEWIEYLSKLQDPILRQKIGDNAHKYAFQNFNIDLITSKFLGILQSEI